MSNKIEAKNVRYHEKEHKKCHKKVASMINKIPNASKKRQTVHLLKDLFFANGDLMHFLSTCEQFQSVDEYFDSINAYLSLEQAANKYKDGVVLAYIPSKMKHLMEVIRLNNNANNRYEELRTKIFGQ